MYTNQQKNLNGKPLKPEDPAIPCGLIAKSIFNDTFVLKRDGTKVAINEKGIAWTSDLDHKFQNTEGGPGEWKDL